jgi:hypothetical protein
MKNDISVFHLLRKRPYTVDALARQLKCSRPAAKRRIEVAFSAASVFGWEPKTKRVRKGLRGPLSKAYFIAD